MYLPSSHDVFSGSVVLNGTLWRSCFSSATNVKSQFPALFIKYCNKANKGTFILQYVVKMCQAISIPFYSTWSWLFRKYEFFSGIFSSSFIVIRGTCAGGKAISSWLLKQLNFDFRMVTIFTSVVFVFEMPKQTNLISHFRCLPICFASHGSYTNEKYVQQE